MVPNPQPPREVVRTCLKRDRAERALEGRCRGRPQGRSGMSGFVRERHEGSISRVEPLGAWPD